MNDGDNDTIIAPGEFIRDELKERGWTQEDLARILGRPLPAVNEIIMGKRAITTQTARELSAAFGTSPDFWLNLETAYQLAKTDDPLGDIQRRAHLFERAPVKEMERRGWIKLTTNIEALESELCRFFRVKSIEEEPAIGIAARQSISMEALTPSQVAWSYRAVHLAGGMQAKAYSPDALRGAMPALRDLARQPELVRQVPRVLAEAGVRLVIVEQLAKTKIDGAALWASAENPVIAISLRYGRMDAFWHTLHHEISHILNEDNAMLDVDLMEGADSSWSIKREVEQRANADAAASLIDPKQLDSFILRVKPLYSKERIVQFANRIKIHPSIVVGQLQHRKEVDWRANREMLVDIRAHIVGQAITDGFGHRPEVG